MEQRIKTWIITDASQGLGIATVKYLLSRHQRVIATHHEQKGLFS